MHAKMVMFLRPPGARRHLMKLHPHPQNTRGASGGLPPEPIGRQRQRQAGSWLWWGNRHPLGSTTGGAGGTECPLTHCS